MWEVESVGMWKVQSGGREVDTLPIISQCS